VVPGQYCMGRYGSSIGPARLSSTSIQWIANPASLAQAVADAARSGHRRLFGADLVLLTLGTSVSGRPTDYPAASTISSVVLAPLAVRSLVTGLLLAAMTHWALRRGAALSATLNDRTIERCMIPSNATWNHRACRSLHRAATPLSDRRALDSRLSRSTPWETTPRLMFAAISYASSACRTYAMKLIAYLP
jgi:hypothetical protein